MEPISKRVTILIGHSGSGKDRVLKELVKLGLKGVVSYTTRPPRVGEVNGVAYHFVSDDEFDRLLGNGEFAEHTEYRGWRYGCLADDLLDGSILIVEPHGLNQLKGCATSKNIGLFVIHVSATEETRRDRIIARGDDPEERERRIESDRSLFAGIEKDCDYIFFNDIDSEEILIDRVRFFLYPLIKHNL